MKPTQSKLDFIRSYLAATIIATKEFKQEATDKIINAQIDSQEYEDACFEQSVMSYVLAYLKQLKVVAMNNEYVKTIEALQYHADRLNMEIPDERMTPADHGRITVNVILNELLIQVADQTALAS